MSEGNRYVLADTQDEPESARLGLLEQWHDPGTFRRLEQLGVGSGWRCLEVGAGRGSVARWLAERVGPSGSVVAADIDLRFLSGLPANVEVRRLDLRSEDPGAAQFDLVHCRFLVMHLPDPDAVLARMAAALRPGGALLVEEGDHGLLHFAGHPGAEALNHAADRMFHNMERSGVMRPWFGRSLPARLAALGLSERGAETQTRISGPGEPDYDWTRATFLAVAPRVMAAGIVGPDWRAVCEAYFGQPGTIASTMSVVAAWGRAPRRSSAG